MTTATRSGLKGLFLGLSGLLLGIAGVSFWVGGRSISEFGKVDRVLAELLGLSIAFVTGALGYILKKVADGLAQSEDSAGQRALSPFFANA